MSNNVTIVKNQPKVETSSSNSQVVAKPGNSATVTSPSTAVKITVGPTPPSNPSYGDLWIQIL